MRETNIFSLPIWRRFQLFFHWKSQKSAIFLVPVYLVYWPRKPAFCWATHVDHFRQVWSWYDYPSPSYGVVSADTLRDLVTLTFDLLTLEWSNMAGHVGNPSTKFEFPTHIRSWLMSYDVRHRPPLTMCLEPLRMRRITWPVRRGKFSQIFEIPDPDLSIHYAIKWLYDQDKFSYLPK